MECLGYQGCAMFIVSPSVSFAPFEAPHMHCTSYLRFHIMSCIMLLAHCTMTDCCPMVVFLFWVEPGDDFVNEDHVEYVHEEQGFDTSENIAGKMIITPDITSIFAC